MPLYARTEKRIKRKEREDELGITAVKDALRENGELGDSEEEEEGDLSDESDSESEDEDEASDSEVNEGEDREDDSAMDGEEDDDDDEENVADEEDDEDDEDEDEDEPFPLTIEEVESNPIYPTDEHEGCLLCPGKTLKNEKMKETHLASSSHNRAMKRWHNRLSQIDERPLPSDDPRDVMNEILDELEDRQAGQPTYTQRKSEAEDETAGTKRKRNREKTKANKVMRKAEEALKRIEGGQDESGYGKGEVKGLNRKARRLLAQREREANGEMAMPSGAQGKGKTAPKTTATAKGKAGTEGTEVKKGYKEEKHERKRKAEENALAGTKKDKTKRR